jgi:hypothetical protein
MGTAPLNPTHDINAIDFSLTLKGRRHANTANGLATKHQECRNKKAQAHYRNDLAGKYKKSECQEEYNLHKPCHPVEYLQDRLLVYQVLVSQVNRTQVDGEEPVPSQEVGCREGKKHQRDYKHRVKTGIIE